MQKRFRGNAAPVQADAAQFCPFGETYTKTQLGCPNRSGVSTRATANIVAELGCIADLLGARALSPSYTTPGRDLGAGAGKRLAPLRAAYTAQNSVSTSQGNCIRRCAAEWPSRTCPVQGYSPYPWIGRHREPGDEAPTTQVRLPVTRGSIKAVSGRGPAFFDGTE